MTEDRIDMVALAEELGWVPSRSDVSRAERREHMLDNIISTYGHEAAPTIYFAQHAYGGDGLYNINHYYYIAMNWVFSED